MLIYDMELQLTVFATKNGHFYWRTLPIQPGAALNLTRP